MMHRRDALRRVLPVLVAIGGGIGLGACRDQPVYEATNGQFQGRGSLAEREALIRRAAASQPGWSVQSMRPGLLRATNTWRSHQMTVDIAFDVRTFSIRYVSSVNLEYDGARIHQNYNTRVQALERAIMAGGGAAMPVSSGGGRGNLDAVPVSGPVVSGE
ncbi:hypothetical protein J5Y09_15350 [Roseomonas sp. PWR1]|uniref:DUF1499 domain-containing protein n=1 Tax=Roseomonas nitratireducens TaxID=2820810 RepID=A0ABS4AVB7_9PROT|nr:hypothetical protein [Neoroseomonas nitratireducens]MBP0465300.1 hypothetical protein [Neoroseomonas nitratireducens]